MCAEIYFTSHEGVGRYYHSVPPDSTIISDTKFDIRIQNRKMYSYNVSLGSVRYIKPRMSKRLHVKYHLSFSDFNETLIFSAYFSRKPRISKLIKISPVEAELFHADRRTNMKLIVGFRNFAKTPKNSLNRTLQHSARRFKRTSAIIRQKQNADIVHNLQMCSNFLFSWCNVALSRLCNHCAVQSLGLAVQTSSFGPSGEMFHNLSIPSP